MASYAFFNVKISRERLTRNVLCCANDDVVFCVSPMDWVDRRGANGRAESVCASLHAASPASLSQSEQGTPCPSCAQHPVHSWFSLPRDLMLPTKRYGWPYFEGLAPACRWRWEHSYSQLGVIRDLIPAMALLTTLVHLFASLSVGVFLRLLPKAILILEECHIKPPQRC